MCFDHRNFDGLLLPTLRRAVRVPDGLGDGGPTAVLLDIYDVAVIDRQND
jgi:hypothetical protein